MVVIKVSQKQMIPNITKNDQEISLLINKLITVQEAIPSNETKNNILYNILCF